MRLDIRVTSVSERYCLLIFHLVELRNSAMYITMGGSRNGLLMPFLEKNMTCLRLYFNGFVLGGFSFILA